jgi:dTDP-4-dehydrorhamnose reductase
MQQILITGGEGQLGQTLQQLTRQSSRAKYYFSTEENLDLTSSESIDRFFTDKDFDVIVNCAAYTAVDKAESDREKAFAINAEAPRMLAEKAHYKGAKMIHISTDYVFGSNNCRPLSPEDPKKPDSVYGQSKLKGEENVVNNCPESVIIRTSWLYSGLGQNFLKTMLRLGSERDHLNVVFDQIGTPTLASDLAGAILAVAESKDDFVPGIYHYSNEGVASWYDFAVAIFRQANISCNVFPVQSDQFPTAAPRPAFSVMDKSLIKETYGITIPHWQDSLAECLKQMERA